MNEARWLAASERWLRLLPRLYPADFRDELGWWSTRGCTTSTGTALYLRDEDYTFSALSFVLRTGRDPMSLVPEVRAGPPPRGAVLPPTSGEGQRRVRPDPCHRRAGASGR